MKQLGVQYSVKQIDKMAELAAKSGVSKSAVARAAMQIGLKAIGSHSFGDDLCTTKEFVEKLERESL